MWRLVVVTHGSCRPKIVHQLIAALRLSRFLSAPNFSAKIQLSFGEL